MSKATHAPPFFQIMKSLQLFFAFAATVAALPRFIEHPFDNTNYTKRPSSLHLQQHPSFQQHLPLQSLQRTQMHTLEDIGEMVCRVRLWSFTAA